MVNLRPIDELKAEVSDVRDKLHLKHISDARQMGKAVWRPHHVGPQCVGCINADIHVASVTRGNYQANELSIYCWFKSRIIQKPYEICKYRREKPKIPIDKWNIIP